MKTIRLTSPVSAEAIASLEIGTVVYLDGVVCTGREGVYKRVVEDGAPFLGIVFGDMANVN
jgi:L(+)-tartrate dehydratase beta subunit